MKTKEEYLQTIPAHNLNTISHMYRVRKDDKFDKTDITQYGYIQDVNKIVRNRLNKAREQVLYTSSYPQVAVLETGIKSDFYLVKYKKREGCSFETFLAIDDDCSKSEKSISRQLRNIMESQFNEAQLKAMDYLRGILEKHYEEDDKNKYKESSELASEIFKVMDCIVTYSLADDKIENYEKCNDKFNCNEHINLTFNKEAADNLLEIETIYHCKEPQRLDSLCYKVTEIGLPNEDYDRIEWFDFEPTDVCVSTVCGPVRDVQSVLQESDKEFFPNVTKNLLNERHCKIVDLLGDGKYYITFNIQLKPKNA